MKTATEGADMTGFAHDPHDREWETGRNLGTTFRSDDEDYCPDCDEYVFDDDGDGRCDDCGASL